jgi:hypothetical protein
VGHAPTLGVGAERIRRLTIIDSSAISRLALNSIICSRAAKIASIRRRCSSGVDRRAMSAISSRISSLTRSPGAPDCSAMASR